MELEEFDFDEFSFISESDDFNSSELNYYKGYNRKYEEYEMQKNQLELEIQPLKNELASSKNSHKYS